METILPRKTRSHRLASPVPSLLQCNRPPLEIDIPLILHTIDKASLELERLEKNSDQPLAPLAARRRKSYKKFYTQHRAILSPIRRLPPELIRGVFLELIEDDGSRKGPLWITGHICGYWRQVALGTPELWCRLPFIVLSSKLRRGDFRFRTTLEILLRRSAGVPLSFYLYAPKFESHVIHPLLKCLLSHSQRWESVTMDIHSSHLNYITFQAKGRFSELKTLNLRVRDITTSIDAFEVAPKLREVQLHTESSPDGISVALPWGQLAHYKETSWNLSHVPQVLHGASCLTSLAYSTSSMDAVNINQVSATTFSQLRSLQLKFYDTEASSASIIDALTLPALEDATIRSFAPSLTNSLISLVHRSSCTLRRLAFYTRPLAEGDLTRLLESTPLLTELEVVDIPLFDLMTLTLQHGQKPLVPHLRELVVHSHRLLPLDLNVMVASRFIQDVILTDGVSEGKCLESVYLVFESSMACFDAQAVLEGWNMLDDLEAHLARGWRIDLEEAMSSLSATRMVNRNKFQRMFHTGHASRRLQQWLSEIENHVFTDARHLYSSGIPLFVRCMGTMGARRVLGNSAEKLRKRVAKAAIEKWHSILLPDLNNRRWRNQGNRCLTFVPGDAKRPSYVLIDAALEHSGDPTDSQVFWPYFEICSFV